VNDQRIDITDDVNNTMKRIGQLAEKLDGKVGRVYIGNSLLSSNGHVKGFNNELTLSPRYIISQEKIKRVLNNEQLARDYDLNSDGYCKDRDFVLAHEVSHIHYGDAQYNLLKTVIILGSCAFVTFNKLSGIVIYPLVAGMIAHSVYTEKRADLKALEILGDNKSAIYMFEQSLAENLRIKDETKNWRNYFIGENGDYYLDYTHPLLSRRLNYAKQFSH